MFHGSSLPNLGGTQKFQTKIIEGNMSKKLN